MKRYSILILLISTLACANDATNEPDTIGFFPYMPAMATNMQHANIAAYFSILLGSDLEHRYYQTYSAFLESVQQHEHRIIFVSPKLRRKAENAGYEAFATNGANLQFFLFSLKPFGEIQKDRQYRLSIAQKESLATDAFEKYKTTKGFDDKTFIVTHRRFHTDVINDAKSTDLVMLPHPAYQRLCEDYPEDEIECEVLWRSPPYQAPVYMALPGTVKELNAKMRFPVEIIDEEISDILYPPPEYAKHILGSTVNASSDLQRRGYEDKFEEIE